MGWDFKVVRVRKVVDGDTIDLELDLGFYQSGVYRFRLLGVDTPEMNSRDEAERERALEARDFVASWLEERAPFLRVTSFKADSFGRWLGEIYSVGATYDERLGTALLESGLAEVYGR